MNIMAHVKENKKCFLFGELSGKHMEPDQLVDMSTQTSTKLPRLRATTQRYHAEDIGQHLWFWKGGNGSCNPKDPG